MRPFYVKCSVCNVQTLLGHPLPPLVKEKASIVLWNEPSVHISCICVWNFSSACSCTSGQTLILIISSLTGKIKQEPSVFRDGPPYQRRGSLQLWQFLVTLLDDPANGHFIAWTGRGMEFKLIEPEEVSYSYVYLIQLHTWQIQHAEMMFLLCFFFRWLDVGASRKTGRPWTTTSWVAPCATITRKE